MQDVLKKVISVLERTDDQSSHEELNEAINQALAELYKLEVNKS